MANPDSLCQPPPRSLEGYGKNINWEKVSDVAQILLGDLYKWFAGEGKLDELVDFQTKLRLGKNLKKFRIISKNVVLVVWF